MVASPIRPRADQFRLRELASPAAHSPGVGLSLRFVMFGITSLMGGTTILLLRPEILTEYHYNQYVVAVTHLFTLGWISSIVMGATYQLVPVALETPLYSPRAARWHFALHVAGVTGMIAMFWTWHIRGLAYFGTLFGLGVGVFVYNIARTLARVPRWTVIGAGIASALGWLILTVLAGLFLAEAKRAAISWFEPLAQMHAHAHLGLVGVFLIMTVAVSYKLLPMFTLSALQSERRCWWSLGLLNCGLAGAVAGVLLQTHWKFAFGLVLAAGLGLYGVELRAILRARQRRTLDWGIRMFLTALALLVPLSVLGLVLAWPGLRLTSFTGQLENVYGFLGVIGVLTFAIIGMLYKIVPFLVWYARYSSEIGLKKVPALADLYSSRLQACGYWLFLCGVVATGVATVFGQTWAVRSGCALLAVSLGLFAVNMGRIVSHLFKPKIEPLSMRTPGARPALTPTAL